MIKKKYIFGKLLMMNFILFNFFIIKINTNASSIISNLITKFGGSIISKGILNDLLWLGFSGIGCYKIIQATSSLLKDRKLHGLFERRITPAFFTTIALFLIAPPKHIQDATDDDNLYYRLAKKFEPSIPNP